MTFREALQTLGIEEYHDRIYNSNSHGELYHLEQYFYMAEIIKDKEEDRKLFPEVFKDIVKHAEENWKRPESVFQHIAQIIIDSKQT